MISVQVLSAIIFVLTVICAMLPVCFESLTKQKLLIALGNSFSSGLFIAVALFHILPEAEMNFSKGMGWKKLNEKFPCCQLIALSVYLLILYIEKVKFVHNHNFEIEIDEKNYENQTKENKSNFQKLHKDNNDQVQEEETKKEVAPEDIEEHAEEIFKDFVSRRSKVMGYISHSVKNISLRDLENVDQVLGNESVKITTTTPKQRQSDFNPTRGSNVNSFAQANMSKSDIIGKNIENKLEEIVEENDAKIYQKTSTNKLEVTIEEQKISEKRPHEKFDIEKIEQELFPNATGQKLPKEQSKGIQISILLLVALSVHSFFEGLALGVSESEVTRMNLFIAIMLHKWAASLTLGISFVKENIMLKKCIIFVFGFALTTPLGIFLGWLMSDMGPVVTSIFMSVSAGTFIYIGGTEIIVEEFTQTKYRWRKYLTFILGIALVTTLKILECLGVLDG